MGNYNFDLDLDSKNTMSVIISWIKDNTTVLEFGPANGRLTRYLAQKKSCRVTIVEIDQESGTEASAYAENKFLGSIQGNIDNLYWYNKQKEYDYIIFADVLEHLKDPGKILGLCRNMLSSDGEILISIPNLAHNSIIIELYNDRFFYDEAGLLDKTHIHFFTYFSFLKMIQNAGLYIREQEAIYSNVGWNEIPNTYQDVPFSIEQKLRQRRSGSIYQYVFRLCLSKQTTEYSFEDIPLLAEQCNLPQEISCYWKNGTETKNLKRVGILYPSERRNKIRLPVQDFVSYLRIDPLETSALVIIYQIAIIMDNGSVQEGRIASHNAIAHLDNLFYFKDTDPQVEILLKDAMSESSSESMVKSVSESATRSTVNSTADFMTDSISKFVECVEIDFEVVDQKISPEQEYVYDQLFSRIKALQNTLEGQKQELLDAGETREFAARISVALQEAIQYNEHLEKDIALVKEDFAATAKEQADYITHLEKDIAILQKTIQRFNQETSEEKNV